LAVKFVFVAIRKPGGAGMKNAMSGAQGDPLRSGWAQSRGGAVRFTFGMKSKFVGSSNEEFRKILNTEDKLETCDLSA
jgi:hypothetical protein